MTGRWMLGLGMLTAVAAGCAMGTESEDVGSGRQALAGREGKIDFAVDAPWRIEPVGDGAGGKDYGAIPVTFTLDDVDLVGEDSNYASIGRFEELLVTEHADDGTTLRRHYSLGGLAAIEESRGHWQYRPPDDPRCGTGPSPTGCPEVRPEHLLCEPWRGEDCTDLGDLSDTSEFSALALYSPHTRTPGARVRLELDVRVSARLWKQERDRVVIVDGELRFHEEVWVLLAPEPLPRFGGGWLYGDLHYHSQGTDNEGEDGYSWLSTAHAMGAMGMDFLFATEHASNSRQIVDVDLDLSPEDYRGLRDMSPERFRFGLERLHDPDDGVDVEIMRQPGGRLPQNVRLRSVVPRIYLGGEVDTIPEVPLGAVYGYGYGNGRAYTPDDWQETAEGTALLIDQQGILDPDFSRQHIVYMPRSPTDREGFVASNTGDHGGGGRRLRELLPEMEAHGYAFLAHPLAGGSGPGGILDAGPALAPYHDRQLEEAFASPAILGLQLWNEDERLETDMGDGDAWNSGQFSIEPDFTFDSPRGDCDLYADTPYCSLSLIPYWERDRGLWHRSKTPTYGSSRGYPIDGVEPDADAHSVYGSLYHGTFTWDRMIRWGLDPSRTAELDWVAAGEPRKVLMAGGSDSHGDFNFRRTGYMVGTTGVNDTAIGRPRNLVYVGEPRVTRERPPALPSPPRAVAPTAGSGRRTAGTPAIAARRTAAPQRTAAPRRTATFATRSRAVLADPPDEVALPPAEPKRYPQEQVVDALRSGQFAVTDGPALRIVVDRNRNGVIDGPDVPMGGSMHLYGTDPIPLLVEWRSTPEFGPVQGIDLYVGAVAGDRGRTYAPRGHGVRDPSDPVSEPLLEHVEYDAQRRTKMRDGYWLDPTGQLHIETGAVDPIGSDHEYHGLHSVVLDPTDFHSGAHHEDTSYYVRAFARTVPTKHLACIAADRELFHRRGECIVRVAYTNPIWILRRERGACVDDPLALDRDGDGLPDSCDGCYGPNEGCLAPPDLPEPPSEWVRTYGGALLDDAQALAQDAAGNIYVGGMFQDTVTFGRRTLSSDGGADGWLAKLTPTGGVAWVQKLGGTGNLRIHDVAVDPTGDVTVTGWFSGQLEVDGEVRTADHDDVFLARFYGVGPDPDPPMRWLRTMTGSGRDVGTSLDVNADGEIALAGYFAGWFDIPYLSGDVGASRLYASGPSDCFVSRWDGPTGRLLWRAPIRGSGACYAEGVARADGGAVVVAGRFDGQLAVDPGSSGGTRTSTRDYDGFVVRYGADGYVDWHTQMGGVAGCYGGDARITEVAARPGGGVQVVGHFRRCLGLSTVSGDSLLSTTGTESFQAFTVRLGALGWTDGTVDKGVGATVSTGNVRLYDIDVRADGSYVVAGWLDAPFVDLGGTWVGGGGRKAFWAVYDADDTLLSATATGSGGAPLVYDASFAPDGHLALCGSFGGIIAPLGPTYSSAGGSDAFVARVLP